MINKSLFMYWGNNKPMSWLKYMTVSTFKKHNSDWNIQIYTSVNPVTEITWDTGEQTGIYTGKDWFPELVKEQGVCSFDMEKIGFKNNLPEVHKSDILRFYFMYKNGGCWSDFDIIYTDKIPESFLTYDNV